MLEKVILSQLQEHLAENQLLDSFQSAYKKNHSTETALLHVMNLLLTNADKKHVSVLALLDLSAAFDTIDHNILLRRLNTTFGISGSALDWFTSYLLDRSQRILVDGLYSSPACLKYGVPQGSVLGPVLFTLYTQPLSVVFGQHGCDFHKYADDTQIEDSAQPSDLSNATHKIELCISDVKDWMLGNKLRLNDSKTEVLCCGPRHVLGDISETFLRVGGDEIRFQNSVRDLGVQIDSELSMNNHISHVCRTANFELGKIASVRNFLTFQATVQLVSSLILSRLDYCNSLFSGLSSTQLSRLQQVQNNAARLIFRKSKKDHVTPLLIELHWLPVIHRIDYKIASLAYRCFDGSLPPYLSSLLTIYQPSRSLRSGSERLLKVPKAQLKTFGQRAFQFQAPSVWNSLPSEIRNTASLSAFKTQIKTYFFRKAFCTS